MERIFASHPPVDNSPTNEYTFAMNIFDWQAKIKERFSALLNGAAAELPHTAYGLMSAVALAPLVSAFASGGPGALWAAMGPIVGGVGGNLLANQMQQWADMQKASESDEAFAAQLAVELNSNATDDSDWRDALDEVHQKLASLELVQQSAQNDDNRVWFVQTLRAEVTELGNEEKYEEGLKKIEITVSGSGAAAFDNGIAAGERGIAANKVKAESINLGDTHHHHYAPGTSPPNPSPSNPSPSNLPPVTSNQGHLTTYLHALRNECDALPLAAMGGEMGMGRELCLGDIYVDLNTTARVKLTEEEKVEAKETGRHLQDDADRPVKVQEAAEQYPYLLLLGDPGSGKSTFVRQLTANNAAALLMGSKQSFPIFVVLHELILGLDTLNEDADFQKARQRERQNQLLELLTSEWTRRLVEWGIADFETDLIAKVRSACGGDVLLILDGLDEIPERLRPLLFEAIPALSNAYSGIVEIIVTCRSRSYSDGMLPGYQPFTLAPFTDEQIADFVEVWYRTQQTLGRMDQRKANYNIQDLQTAALDNLRELADNPMLLTTMTIIHQRDTKLPEQRVELYKQAVDVLMNRWQQGKDQVINLPPKLDALLADNRKLRRILERLAYEAHKAQSSTHRSVQDINQNEDEMSRNDQPLARGMLLVLLEELLNDDIQLATDFLDYIDHRAGLLVGRGGSNQDIANRRAPTYSFPHRTFQEYLAGCYMNHGRDFIRTYLKHVEEEDYWNVAALLGAEELFHNNHNDNAVLDLAYALCTSATPRSESAWRSVVWSGQIAAMIGRTIVEADKKPGGGKAYLKRLIRRLIRLPQTNTLAPIERAEAGRKLGQLDDSRYGVGLKNNLPDINWSTIEEGPFIMGTDLKEDNDGWMDEEPQFSCNLITQAYNISRYLITVKQYSEFAKAGGYHMRKYWTDAGWKWRNAQDITCPETYDPIFQTLNHPQVGVSWYEAVAFCRWLSQVFDTEIMLPSEAHWERAARDTDGRIYPWKGEFDANNCNTFDAGIGSTSAVGFFPSSNAECGASDMAGNVLEWCRTKWLSNYEDYEQKVDNDLEGGMRRLWRGGSFVNLNRSVRCAYRYSDRPEYRSYGLGFRVMASVIAK